MNGGELAARLKVMHPGFVYIHVRLFRECGVGARRLATTQLLSAETFQHPDAAFPGGRGAEYSYATRERRSAQTADLKARPVTA